MLSKLHAKLLQKLYYEELFLFGRDKIYKYLMENYEDHPSRREVMQWLKDQKVWQLQYQALDEIQMQQRSVLLGPAERALQNLNSKLNRQGRQFAKQLTSKLAKPVYYALYRGTSSDCAKESQRLCPSCKGEWLRKTPLADLFDFQCDRCLLVSNIAWQCQ